MTDQADDRETNVSSDADARWRPCAESSGPAQPANDSDRSIVVDHTPVEARSPWSPESDAVFAPAAGVGLERVGVATEEGAQLPTAVRDVADGETVRSATGRSTRNRWVALVVVAVLTIAGGVVARSVVSTELAAGVVPGEAIVGSSSSRAPIGPEPLVDEPFVGADRRRLPERLDQRWRIDVTGVSATGRTTVTVLDDGAVVGVFDDPTVDDGQPASVIALLAGADGTEQWRTSFDSQARAFDVLGGFGDVVVLERLDTANRSVLGLSTRTGEVLWVRETNDPGVHVVLEGTELVARVSFTVNARLTFIDPATGDEVGRVPGRLFATDFLGTWYVRNGDVVSKLELGDGWSPPTPFDTLWVDDDETASVVGGRLIAIDDGWLQTRGDDGAPTNVSATAPAGSGGFADFDLAASFVRLSPMVGDSFIAVGSRSVFGVELGENGDADVRWSATGTPIESRPTDRGLALLVATEGGGAQRILDASTGREIAVVEIVPGSIDTLQLVGNGVVLKRAAQVGFERVGLDLDGNRLWSLVGDGPLAIGVGVLVTYGPSDDGIAVTAYGDATS